MTACLRHLRPSSQLLIPGPFVRWSENLVLQRSYRCRTSVWICRHLQCYPFGTPSIRPDFRTICPGRLNGVTLIRRRCNAKCLCPECWSLVQKDHLSRWCRGGRKPLGEKRVLPGNDTADEVMLRVRMRRGPNACKCESDECQCVECSTDLGDAWPSP